MKGGDGKEEEGTWDREERPRGPAGSSEWGSWACELGEARGSPCIEVLARREGRKQGKDGGEEAAIGRGVGGRPRGEGRRKKLPGPSYQDLKRGLIHLRSPLTGATNSPGLGFRESHAGSLAPYV